MEATRQETGHRRRRGGWWLWLSGVVFLFACVTTAFGFVVVGPLTVESQAGRIEPSPAASPVVEPIPAPAVTASPADIATATATDVFDAPDITIQPPPEPPKTTGRRPGGGTTNPSGGYLTYTEYCVSPESPYTTGSADPSAILTLVNQERARIGLSGLSWSSSLASTASAWSQAMADADDATPGVPGDALAHGMLPSPGGQNVAMNWRSPTYYSTTQSMNIAHSGWVYSYGHCTNLMRPGWSVMGVGGAMSSEGVWYWTENFQ